MQAKEEESRLARHDAPFMLRRSVRAEHRQVDPRKPRLEPGAPYDVRDIENATVVEERQSVADADDA